METMKKDFSKLGLMFLAGSAVIYAAQMVVSKIVGLINPALLEDSTWGLVFAVLPLYLIGMPILIMLVKKIPGTAPEQHEMKVWHLIVAFVMCYAIMYCSNLVGVGLVGIVSLIKGAPVNNLILNIATSANMGVTFFYMVICAPIMEEYIFRKLIVDRTLRYGQGVAVVVSGLMFGLFHGNLSQFVYAATLGMFFAFIYVKTGKLKYSIILHMIINFMGSILGVLILKAIDIEAFTEISASGNPDEIMAFVMNNIGGWVLYFVYICFILAMVVTGIVLLIVFRKRFKVESGEVSIPKGERFSTIFLNFGMLVYSLFWIAMIVVQLVQ